MARHLLLDANKYFPLIEKFVDDLGEAHSQSFDSISANEEVASFWMISSPIPQSAVTLVDGMAKLIGACDLVVRQVTGATSMLIGFSVASRALSPVIRAINAEPRRLVIIGGSFLASHAIASAVELGMGNIVVVSPPVGGPGTAVAAAHSMSADVTSVVPRKFHPDPGDLVIDTDLEIFAQVYGGASQPDYVVRTYLSAQPHLTYRMFLARYLRELIVVATGRDVPIVDLQLAVDNFFGV
ncbi:hypothetical protein JTE88_04255 [Arcanobacterium phocisimile]|uniref:Uncharacterized protein n=1 Tax=Arcanobacterium phocisimile TaxID=1302235 RepID=A0ABX7IJC1_9ACTO|nr:hypothetical protein [Arcanobacterium phocisimile]QRV02937.1 hypothetical protein JTE88_04255 [Arcanobacterium phocisimile]